MTNLCLAVQEEKLKWPLSDMESWKLARVRSNRKDGEGEYYGKTEENLTAYTEEYQRLDPGSAFADPIQSKTDETAVVGIQPMLHGCYPVLDGVITPSIYYTCV
jgi:hypothetical protein